MAGGLFLLVAGGLAAVAGWIWLAQWRDPVWASLIVAGGCTVTGAVLLLLARPRRRRAAAPDPQGPSDRDALIRALFVEAGLRVPPRGESPALVEAFLFGLTTALRLRRDPPR